MDFYHRTNYGQNEPVNKAISILTGLFGVCDDDSWYVFRNGSSQARLESGLICCDCNNNILDVAVRAISMAVCLYFLNYFFSIVRLKKSVGVYLC
jgi:hypothetical protein